MTRPIPSTGWRARAALLTVLIAVAAVASGDHPQNDAGSGGDAGNTRDAALTLADYGSFKGGLTPHDANDWYSVADPTPGPACIRLEARGDNNLTSTLIVTTPTGERSMTTYAAGGKTAGMTIATSEVNMSEMHFRPSPNEPNSGSPARPGEYDFTISAKRSASMSDAGTGTDAGSKHDSSILIEEGCHGGRIGLGQMSLDSVDYYRIFVPAGQTLYYSLGADVDAPLQLLLENANGDRIGETIGPDGFAAYTPSTDQMVYMQASTTKLDVSQFPYLIGLEIGPPEPGCNPHC